MSYDASGILNVTYATANAIFNCKATSAITAAINSDVVLRVAVNIGNAAVGGIPSGTLRFFQSVDEGTTFTQIGNDVAANGGNTNLLQGPASGTMLSIGSISTIQSPANMEYKRLQLIADASTIVDADFSNQTPGATSFTASTGQVFTVVSPGVIQ